MVIYSYFLADYALIFYLQFRSTYTYQAPIMGRIHQRMDQIKVHMCVELSF